MRILTLLFCIFLFFDLQSAAALDDFFSYQRSLLPGVSLTQRDETTSLLYRGRVIKTYQNAEYALELLAHGPLERPDCFNSRTPKSLTLEQKNATGKEYLKNCLIMRSERIGSRYLLFYHPSSNGYRVSVYDVRAQRYFHGIVGDVQGAKRYLSKWVVFLTRSPYDSCTDSLRLLRGTGTSLLATDCSLSLNSQKKWHIADFRIKRKNLIIDYQSYVALENGDLILDPNITTRTLILP